MSILRSAFALLSLALAPLAAAQSTAAFSGHWEGAIRVPGTDLAIQVDLAKSDKGEWMGAIDIPPQHLKGFPLSSISVKGNSVAFVMKGPPGDPSFNGKLSGDGQSMSGDFIQGGGTVSFDLKRTGDARMEAPAKSTGITKELEGTWEGALDVNGTKLRLVLKMANQPDGLAGGSIVSLDQGGGEIPITSITQKDSHLSLDIKTIGGSYSGDLKQGALAGEWSQGGGTLPLTFQRPTKEDKK